MSSKLHKTGSIFARIDGLLKTGVKKMKDRPIWYDIYKAYPPTYEPVLNKPLPDCKIRPIFYKEDIARAKLHTIMYKSRVWHLRGLHKDKSIKTYLDKLEEGLSEDEAFNHVKTVLIANAQRKIDAKKVATNVRPKAVEEVTKNANPEAVQDVTMNVSPATTEEVTKSASPAAVEEVTKNASPEAVEEVTENVRLQTVEDSKKK